MMGGYGIGAGWMMLMPLLWIALIGLAVWAIIRLTQGQSQSRDVPRQPYREASRETPREILDRRFAAGEIDAATYEEARTRLAAGSGPG